MGKALIYENGQVVIREVPGWYVVPSEPKYIKTWLEYFIDFILGYE